MHFGLAGVILHSKSEHFGLPGGPKNPDFAAARGYYPQSVNSVNPYHFWGGAARILPRGNPFSEG